MLTFIHAADFHLDSPFHALPPELAIARRKEQRQLLSDFAELVVREKADLVLLPGDLLDATRSYPETVQQLFHTLCDLPSEVFISPGNHDPFTPNSPYARLDWPPHIHLFSSVNSACVELPKLDASVCGAAFTDHHRMDSPNLAMPSQAKYRFGAFHGDLGSDSSRYAPISLRQIEASGLNYLALGHVHTFTGLKRAGNTFYAYPGCPQGRGFDETGEKGVLVGHIDDETFSLDFVPLATRNYQIISVDITDKDPKEELEKILPELGQNDVIRICLTGARDPEADFSALPALVAPYCYSLSFRDETRLATSVWERAGEDTLTGLFLRIMNDKIARALPSESAQLDMAARYGLAALEGREEPL